MIALIQVIAKSGVDQGFDDFFAQTWVQVLCIGCAVLILFGIVVLIGDGFDRRRKARCKLEANVERARIEAAEALAEIRELRVRLPIEKSQPT